MNENMTIQILPVTFASEIINTYVGWLNNSDVTEHLNTKTATESSCKRYINKILSEGHSKMFWIIADDKYVGTCTLQGIDYDKNTATVGIMIGEPDCWNKGVGSMAIELLKDYACEQLGITKLSAGVELDNLASIKMFHNCGFKDNHICMKCEKK